MYTQFAAEAEHDKFECNIFSTGGVSSEKLKRLEETTAGAIKNVGYKLDYRRIKA